MERNEYKCDPVKNSFSFGTFLALLFVGKTLKENLAFSNPNWLKYSEKFLPPF